MPVLDYLIKEASMNDQALDMTETTHSQKTKSILKKKYIQNAGVKYAFPLDEDETLESDYL